MKFKLFKAMIPVSLITPLFSTVSCYEQQSGNPVVEEDQQLQIISDNLARFSIAWIGFPPKNKQVFDVRLSKIRSDYQCNPTIMSVSELDDTKHIYVDIAPNFTTQPSIQATISFDISLSAFIDGTRIDYLLPNLQIRYVPSQVIVPPSQASFDIDTDPINQCNIITIGKFIVTDPSISINDLDFIVTQKDGPGSMGELICDVHSYHNQFSLEIFTEKYDFYAGDYHINVSICDKHQQEIFNGTFLICVNPYVDANHISGNLTAARGYDDKVVLNSNVEVCHQPIPNKSSDKMQIEFENIPAILGTNTSIDKFQLEYGTTHYNFVASFKEVIFDDIFIKQIITPKVSITYKNASRTTDVVKNANICLAPKITISPTRDQTVSWLNNEKFSVGPFETIIKADLIQDLVFEGSLKNQTDISAAVEMMHNTIDYDHKTFCILVTLSSESQIPKATSYIFTFNASYDWAHTSQSDNVDIQIKTPNAQ